uniref:Uncharacterized protein n=1 Tax=Dromaius novaehollandiae TaxID=8790 RepID=A0A8C4K2L0_DRONO
HPARCQFGRDPTCRAWDKVQTRMENLFCDIFCVRKTRIGVYRCTTYRGCDPLRAGRELGRQHTAWASHSNPTTTCAVDGAWKPILVLLHISWADSCVKGSPVQNKFALSSRFPIISVCYFEEEND